MKKQHLYLLTFLLSLNLFSQNFGKSLKELKTENQNCLDTGEFMYNCSLEFYKKSDSLLNLVYNNVRKQLNSDQKDKLKQEQLSWLKQRDKKFEIINNYDTGLGNGLDDLMSKTQDKSKVVNKRTLFLIEKFINKPNSEINKFIPENYSILDSKKGNLNMDEFEDYVLILKNIEEDKKSEKRILLILTSNLDGKLELKAKNENTVLCIDCSGAIHGDSYNKTVIKNGYFSIEHYTVGGNNKWLRIVTFKYDSHTNNWFLNRDRIEYFGTNKSDSPDAEAIIKTGEKILTTKDFGKVKFEDFNIYE
jgi:uncharacterized protein YecT (DUF1311 family)|tara:strand:- start:5800 stop:6714 length:915 start_codon:yes stop_codon:yes gene_type:complete